MPTKEEKNNFSLVIEQRVKSQNVSYMEAILDYCTETGLEPEIAGTLVNPILKAKLEQEAMELRFLPRISQLPI